MLSCPLVGVVLFTFHLVDALLVTTALEVCGEELVHDATGHVGIDEAAGHDEHVGIVVLTDEVGNLGNPAQAGAYVLMLVQCHGNALTASADGDAGVHFALLDTTSQSMAEVAVVATILGVGTESL